MMFPNTFPVARFAVAYVTATIVTACASGPTIRTDYDKSADFSAYHTYGFASELGTDRAGYSTFITEHFKRAVSRELEARGYRAVESNPDLVINFFANVRERTDVRSTPGPMVGIGYYGYRYGLYTGWPLYGSEVTTVTYRIGTANVDVVDARRNQLIWEGVVEGRLTDDVLANPGPAIESVVADTFARYPARAGAGAISATDD